jgi:type I restriction enzyme S subunit
MIRKYYKESASGTSDSMPKINQQIVSLTKIPLPPLAEQKRIVDKLDELLPQIDCMK